MNVRHLRLAIFLGVAGAVSTALVFPYLLALMPRLAQALALTGASMPALIAAQMAQAFVLFTLMSWVGLRVGETLRLDAPIFRAWAYRTSPVPFDRRALALACAIGLVGAMAIVFIDDVLRPFMPAAKTGLPVVTERWRGFLASFYGGIGEEIQLRLFLMTLLMWVARRLLAAPAAAWLAIVVAALAFSAGHLPTAAQIWPLDAVVVFRTMLLNMIIGIPCGWLYWRHGLEYAVATHFAADIVLHVASAGA
jgi:hypothetical protein